MLWVSPGPYPARLITTSVPLLACYFAHLQAHAAVRPSSLCRCMCKNCSETLTHMNTLLANKQQARFRGATGLCGLCTGRGAGRPGGGPSRAASGGPVDAASIAAEMHADALAAARRDADFEHLQRLGTSYLPSSDTEGCVLLSKMVSACACQEPCTCPAHEKCEGQGTYRAGQLQTPARIGVPASCQGPNFNWEGRTLTFHAAVPRSL